MRPIRAIPFCGSTILTALGLLLPFSLSIACVAFAGGHPSSDEPAFLPSGGAFPAPIDLLLHPPHPTATIRYTLDGSRPDATSKTYHQPIHLSQTTAVRAQLAWADSLLGPVITHTYIIADPSELPILSLVTDPRNLWDEESGILAMGPNASPDYPHYGANFWNRWERPAHIEYFEEDGTSALRMDLGLAVHGGITRAYPQKPLRVIARGRYGHDRIGYPFFPSKPLEQFKSLVLRCGGNDWWLTLLRSPLLHLMARHADLDWQGYRPARVYLNGEYWGLCNLRERPDSLYIDANRSLAGIGLDLLESGNGAIAGSTAHFDRLMAFIESHDLSAESVFDSVQAKMDTRQYARYYGFNILCGNTDWPGANVRAWRAHAHDGRWRWIITDVDYGLGLWDYDYTHNTLAFALNEHESEEHNPPESTFLMRRLLANERYQQTFINTLADLLNTVFSPEQMHPLFDSLVAHAEVEMPRHLARWNRSPAAWREALDEVRNYIDRRPSQAREHIRQQFALSGEYTLTLDGDPPGSGRIALTTTTIDSRWSGVYFLGVPAPLVAIPEVGFRFSRWSDSSLPAVPRISITPTGTYELTALFEPSEAVGDDVILSEINYRSAPDFDTADWIEIFNPTPTPVDLGGWQVVDGQNHLYELPPGVVLYGGECIVLCRDLAKFKSFHSELTNALGDFEFGLSPEGERISLLHADGSIVDKVTYGSGFPWPSEANGHGPTLELTFASADNTHPESWRASPGHGSPGRGPAMFTATAVHGTLSAFPNPVRSRAYFSFHLEREGEVCLTLYDVTGRCVGPVVRRHLGIGDHVVGWATEARDGGRLQSGLYWMALESDQFRACKQLLILSE